MAGSWVVSAFGQISRQARPRPLDVAARLRRARGCSRPYHKIYTSRPTFPGQPRRFEEQSSLRKWVLSPRFSAQMAGVGILVGGLYISQLEEVPVTGRRRFNVVSTQLEARLAKDQFESIISDVGGRVLLSSDARVRLVKRVMDRLVRSAGLDGTGGNGDVKWEVFVVDEREPNAFVIPGGKVFVNTGILPICRNEDALAAVLGHEIAHTLARHSAERMSIAAPLLAINWVASMFLGIPPVFTGWLVETAFLMPGSRTHESEADYIGLLMMAQACYNPAEAVGLWSRMEQIASQYGNQPPEFLSTHPSNETRVVKIKGWLPEAESIRQASNCQSAASALTEFWRRLGYARF